MSVYDFQIQTFTIFASFNKSMYYYRNKRKKSKNVQQQETTVVAPLNDVWESFQEPKSYKEFGISDEAFAFLSNPEKGKLAQENNEYWNTKKSKAEKAGCSVIIVLIVLLHIAPVVWVILLKEADFFKTILIVLVAAFIVSVVIYFTMTIRLNRKLIYTYDSYENNYKKYVEYIDQYTKKKEQYFFHLKELEGFKTNEEITFLNSIADRLRMVQGKTYRTAEEWQKMTDREFEFEIGKVYSRLGYQTQVTKRSGDGGVDVIAKKDKETIYIQCKHYGANTHLGAPELQAFWGCCSGNGISKGVMVCTSSLTKDARSFANKLKGKLEIIGMKELLELDKAFFLSHPINSQKQFADAFKSFISSNNFVDCNHLWLMSKVYYNEEDAKKDMATLTKWKTYTYLLKDSIVKLTNKIRVYVILLVPDYALEETKNVHV